MDELLLAHVVPLLNDAVDQLAVLGACKPSQGPRTPLVTMTRNKRRNKKKKEEEEEEEEEWKERRRKDGRKRGREENAG
jgi:hypothetical protein